MLLMAVVLLQCTEKASGVKFRAWRRLSANADNTILNWNVACQKRNFFKVFPAVTCYSEILTLGTFPQKAMMFLLPWACTYAATSL